MFEKVFLIVLNGEEDPKICETYKDAMEMVLRLVEKGYNENDLLIIEAKKFNKHK